MTSSTPPSSLADRFALLIAGLCAIVAGAFSEDWLRTALLEWLRDMVAALASREGAVPAVAEASPAPEPGLLKAAPLGVKPVSTMFRIERAPRLAGSIDTLCGPQSGGFAAVTLVQSDEIWTVGVGLGSGRTWAVPGPAWRWARESQNRVFDVRDSHVYFVAIL